MTKGILNVIQNAKTDGSIVVGFNVLGYEDAYEVVRAADERQRSVLLMTNRACCQALPVKHWGALLRSIAESASVPVSAHLDHCSDLDVIFEAIDSGYTSVMYDGCKLPLEENIKNAKKVVEYAHANGVFVECELGDVPYSDISDAAPILTDPDEVKRFCEEVDTDMLAVSVGNIHRQTSSATRLNFDVLQQIQNSCDVPLVVHGASGLFAADKEKMKEYHIAKINVGTNLRMTFSDTLRQTMQDNPKEFDRLRLFEPSRKAVFEAALKWIDDMNKSGD